MEALIRVVNRIQDAFSGIGIDEMKAIDLPQIVVVGAQSAGKSSVLESIVGQDFLPRGGGMVTRRPLVLQLIHLDDKTRKRYGFQTTDKQFGRFSHTGDKIYSNFDEIRDEIKNETDRSTESKKVTIDSDPIRLTIFSEIVTDLTLVDLPGLIKVPLPDQPVDIEDQIKTLVLNFIENSNSVILAVTPAYEDMANMEALKLARQVDPDGQRTIAVFTKFDRVEDGVNAREMLSGGIIKVKLGIIAVINRAPSEVTNNKTIADARKDEQDFFANKYPDIADQHGTKVLSQRLNKLLMSHIRTRLPDLRKRIGDLTKANTDQLAKLGEAPTDKGLCLLQLINGFVQAYSATLSGNVEDFDIGDNDDDEFMGGARISQHIFQNAFAQSLFSVDALGDLDVKTIVAAIRSASGLIPPLSVPAKAFQRLVKRQIKRMISPCIDCVGLVNDELQRCVRSCNDNIMDELMKYPQVYENMVNIASEFVRKTAESTEEDVKFVVNIQVAYIDCTHPAFSQEKEALLQKHSSAKSENTGDGSQKQAASPGKLNFREAIKARLNQESQSCGPDEKNDPEKPSVRELENVEMMKCLVSKYFSLVQEVVYDTVPKAIVHSLVAHTREKLNQHLLAELYTPAMTKGFDILEEAKEITEKRTKSLAMSRALKEATKCLDGVCHNI
ncbi:dynamin-1-like protein isoform X1 [Paramacrobiotus metropolitanus]|uniref:dynamin-1-like protein isoform X1 n=1 Tax=Paramacrobiotus metropolitanus TaxID=2943436 RepID=UPI00244571DA|nr:dynamin-1-like protein isoform X1 [Paramacrobiotus metropolitanus]